MDGRPLRICLLTYRGNPTCGGQGIYIKKISRALVDLGHAVEVVSGPPYPELGEDIPLRKIPSLDLYDPNALFRIPALHELRSPVNALEWLSVSTGGFPEPLTFSLRTLGFFQKLQSNTYDVVHDNQSLAYGLLGIRRLGYPLVATIHHPITFDRDAEIQAAGRWWKRLKVRRWYAFTGMQTQVSMRIPHIVTVSERSKIDIARTFRLPVGRIRVVPNGIDTDIFHPLPHLKRDKNRIIVTNSADMPLKGLRYLLEAVASIVRKREVRLTVIGTPKRNGEIERLVRELHLGRCLEFTGRIEDKDFPYYYATSTLAVVSSLYEGFGFPAGEAMACGTPVVSTTGGALPEVVGDAGILVPPADSRALEKAILHLLDHPEKRRALSRAGLQRVHRYFTWNRTAQGLVSVYREAMRADGGLH